MSRCLRHTSCLLLLVLLCATPATGQHLPDGAMDWYLPTSDDTELYGVEFGAAAVPGDTVVVLHGGWGAEHTLHSSESQSQNDEPTTRIFRDDRIPLAPPSSDF